MAKISEIQAESGVLEGTAAFVSDVSFTPSGSNNGVSADGGIDYLKINAFVVPVGTTKILFFVKKKIANAINSTLSVSYIGSGSPQYNIFNQVLTNEGVHFLEVTTLPVIGNNTLILDGSNMTYDRIEFHDNTVVAGGSDIITEASSILKKSSAIAKFRNTGDAISSGATITFLPTFSPVYGGTITPTSTKGTFSANGSNWLLTITTTIAANETFDVNLALSAFIKKSTVFTFDVVSVTGFTENNLTNDTTSATFTPTADLSVTEVSKTSSGFSINVTNIGTDAIASGQVLSIKANGSNVPTGVNLSATTSKGVFSGSDWVNGVSLTLSSELAVGELFVVTFAFASPVNIAYTAATSAVWQSTITDAVPTNNSINITYTPSLLVAPAAPILSTVLAVYSGDAQTGTAQESGTILMLLNGNIVSQTTTSGVTNAWSIICANSGSYTFKLTNNNGTSLASSAVAVVARPSTTSTSTNDAVNKITNTNEKAKIFTTTNILIAVGVIIVLASLYWAFNEEQ